MAVKKKEEAKMMNSMMTYNMANMMAEDTGAFELRNPVISGMHGNERKDPMIIRKGKKGWLFCLLSLVNRH